MKRCDGAVEIVTVRLDVPPDRLAALEVFLSQPELRRAERFRFERDRRRFVASRAHLRLLLADRLGDDPSRIDLVTGPFGKPGLASGDLRFNASRSRDLAAFAFARDREVGIDIEFLRDLPDAEDLAARFFSRREWEAYAALGPSERTTGFFNGWTRKEAVLKAIGEGLSNSIDRFDVSLAPAGPARILRFGDAPGEACGWTLDEFSPAPGAVGAVAFQAAIAEKAVRA